MYDVQVLLFYAITLYNSYEIVIVKRKPHINHNYLSRNLKFVLNISTASRSLLQQTEVTDVSHDQCHVTQAGVGLVGAPGRRLGSE